MGRVGTVVPPTNVEFCQESRVLVRDIDHFCPWTGTTIAGGNIRYFYSFIIGLFVQIFVLMGVFLAGNSAVFSHRWQVGASDLVGIALGRWKGGSAI